jgi:hypothetical protein
VEAMGVQHRCTFKCAIKCRIQVHNTNAHTKTTSPYQHNMPIVASFEEDPYPPKRRVPFRVTAQFQILNEWLDLQKKETEQVC